MRELTLDGSRIHSREDFYHSLGEQLELPDYFGDNLDALHDVLEESGDQTVLTITCFRNLKKALTGRYLISLFTMLTDSGGEIHILS